MELTEAMELLGRCERHENRDHAFGDVEVFWTYDDSQVAEGYFNRSDAYVHIMMAVDVFCEPPKVGGSTNAQFTDTEARRLRGCGKLGQIGRNDTTGPDTFSEGVTMSALTLDGVREELEGGHA